MTNESQSLNAENLGFEVTVGLLIPRPVDPKHLPRLIKMRQPYVDAGLMPPLEDLLKPEEHKEEPK